MKLWDDSPRDYPRDDGGDVLRAGGPAHRKPPLTPDRLRELLHYDPETGFFTWRVGDNRRLKIGARAGCWDREGYRVIGIGRRQYREHRLAWLYMTGRWPTPGIDHINCIRDDNRFCNLREATRQQNQGNIRRARNNTSGFKGVTWDKQRNKWVAQIRRFGRLTRLGFFDDPAAAYAVYADAAREHFGEFARLEDQPSTIHGPAQSYPSPSAHRGHKTANREQ